MPTIRHEINILNTIYTTGDSVELIKLSPDNYNGTLTWYLEIVGLVSSGTATVTLHGSDHVAHATISLTSTTASLQRVQFSSSPTLDTYHINVAGGTGTSVKAARVICLQTADFITKSEFQMEIGNYFSTTAITATPLPYPKYCSLPLGTWDANGSGNMTMSIHATVSASSRTTNVVLQSGTYGGTWYKVKEISGSSGLITGTVAIGTETSSFSNNYRVAIYGASSMNTYYIYNAKMVINLDNSTGNGAFVDNSTLSIIQLYGEGGNYEALGQSFLTYEAMSLDAIWIGEAYRTGAPTDSLYVEIHSDSINGTLLGTGTYDSIALNYAFSPPISLSANTKYYYQIHRTGANDSPSYYNFDKYDSSRGYLNGEYYIKHGGNWSSGSPEESLSFKISAPAPPFKKFLEKYDMLNTYVDTGTGLQNAYAQFLATDWDGTNNTYKYFHDATNASDSSKLVSRPANTDITSAVVTGIYQVIATTGFTPTSLMDVNITNSTGVITHAGFLVNISLNTAPVTNNFTETGKIQTLLSSIGSSNIASFTDLGKTQTLLVNLIGSDGKKILEDGKIQTLLANIVSNSGLAFLESGRLQTILGNTTATSKINWYENGKNQTLLMLVNQNSNISYSETQKTQTIKIEINPINSSVAYNEIGKNFNILFTITEDDLTVFDGYIVERRIGTDGTWTQIGTVTSLSTMTYEDSYSFVNGTSYFYRVKKTQDGVESDYSNIYEVLYTIVSGVPVINIISYTLSKISDEIEKNVSTITFVSDKDLTEWEARADGLGNGQGLLVGNGTNLLANTETSFDVDYSELTFGDKVYRINIYGKNPEGWSAYE